MATWDVSRSDGVVSDRCGYCGAAVPHGEPIQLLGPQGDRASRRKRCVDHAHGPVDWEAIDAARLAHEREVLERSQPSALQYARPTVRAPRPRSPQSLSAIAGGLFDPKSAAANDRDEE